VYYVQYAHARICSILRQEEIAKILASTKELALEKAERQLLLKIIRLKDELAEIASSFALHRLPTYATELAALFHAFYHDCRVITSDLELTAQRKEIIEATKVCLHTIFELLGVSSPEKM